MLVNFGLQRESLCLRSSCERERFSFGCPHLHQLFIAIHGMKEGTPRATLDLIGPIILVILVKGLLRNPVRSRELILQVLRVPKTLKRAALILKVPRAPDSI